MQGKFYLSDKYHDGKKIFSVRSLQIAQIYESELSSSRGTFL